MLPLPRARGGSLDLTASNARSACRSGILPVDAAN
jgi:hypothetical protein